MAVSATPADLLRFHGVDYLLVEDPADEDPEDGRVPVYAYVARDAAAWLAAADPDDHHPDFCGEVPVETGAALALQARTTRGVWLCHADGRPILWD